MAHAAAAAPPNPYKALVCIFMFGGNDSNNMVIPVNASGNAGYNGMRSRAEATSRSRRARSRRSRTRCRCTGLNFGLHPAMPELKGIFDAGNLAIVANVGPLTRRPTTKATVSVERGLPPVPALLAQRPAVRVDGAPSRTFATTVGWGGLTADNDRVPEHGNRLPDRPSRSPGTTSSTSGSRRDPVIAAPAPTALNQIFPLNGFANNAIDNARRTAFNYAPDLRHGRAAREGDERHHAAGHWTSRRRSRRIPRRRNVPELGPRQPAQAGREDHQAEPDHAQRQPAGLLLLDRRLRHAPGRAHVAHEPLRPDLEGDEGLPRRDGRPGARQATSRRSRCRTSAGRWRRPARDATVGSDHAWGSHQFVMGGAIKAADFYGSGSNPLAGLERHGLPGPRARKRLRHGLAAAAGSRRRGSTSTPPRSACGSARRRPSSTRSSRTSTASRRTTSGS